MRRVLLGLLCVLLGTCAPPDQGDPARFGIVRVFFARDSRNGINGFTQDALRAFPAYLGLLSRVGPTFQLAPSAADADVTVFPFASANCAAQVGVFHGGSAYVEIDPACVPSESSRHRAVGHELLHWWTFTRAGWTGHICRAEDARTPGCHPAITADDALLAPTIGTASDLDGPGFDHAYSPGIVNEAPQEPDLLLVRRCLAARGCP